LIRASPGNRYDTGRKKVSEFLLARGGPFYALQRQLGLLHENAFRAGSRALLFVTIAWGIPLVFSMIAGSAFWQTSDSLMIPYFQLLKTWSNGSSTITSLKVSECAGFRHSSLTPGPVECPWAGMVGRQFFQLLTGTSYSAVTCRSSTTKVEAYNSTTAVPKDNIHTRGCAIACKSCVVFPPFGVSNTPWWCGENETEYGPVPIWMGVTEIQDFRD